MISSKSVVALLALALSLAFCTSHSADQKILEQAAAIHHQADQLAPAVKPLIDELEQRSNSLNIQGRALQPEELDFLARAEAAAAAYRFYVDNHAEVPGFEHHGHDHDHDHDHDHHHGPQTKITAEHALAIQQELLDSLQSAKAQAEALLQGGL
jgi:hypothetical protein